MSGATPDYLLCMLQVRYERFTAGWLLVATALTG
jgi:hypothetical protein